MIRLNQELSLKNGDQVNYQEKIWVIKAPVNLEKVLLENPLSGEKIIAPISDLVPPIMDEDKISVDQNKPDISIISETTWQLALQRRAIIDPLAKQARFLSKDIKQASQQLSLTSRQIYNLIRKYQISGCEMSSLIPAKPSGGRGGSRLPKGVEQIIQDVIGELYLSPQKLKASLVIEEINRRCHHLKISRPSGYAVRQRLNQLPTKIVLGSRESNTLAKHKTGSFPGKTPQPDYPLSVFQIDHTLVDIIIVNALDRRPIGRPYLTVAIDVYSRCIAGFCLTLEPPSAVSVGLCLAHSVHDKNAWLIQRNLTSSWPIWGKPDAIVVDNATEFHSEALQRGCEYHGIHIEFRPPGQPHWGGVIERLIGTLMHLIHQLPGTTFSDIEERGSYDAEKFAALTLEELERWLTIAIVDYYHQKPHGSLLKPPIEQYHSGILGKDKISGKGYPPRLQNHKAFLVDFLPIARRQLRPQGLVLDHITYFTNTLTPLIAERHRYGSLIVRRDPRDLSRVYLLDPRSQTYLEIPYRHLARPTITLWEHRHARQRLQEQGKASVDEDKIFSAIEQMRSLAKQAVKTSKRVRREEVRREQNAKGITKKHIDSSTDTQKQSKKIDSNNHTPPKPFDDIEI